MSQLPKPRQTRSPWAWNRILWLVGILLVGPPATLFLIHVIRVGYTDSWTGFGQSMVNGKIQPAKTMWDWLDLLIIPIVLAIGGYLFSRSQTQTTREAAELGAQDDTLQAYLDRMAQLLKDKEQPLHKAQSGDNLSTLARALTLTVLSTVGLSRKRSVLEFLHETGLIYREQVLLDESNLIKRRHNIVNLKDANLREADLGGVDLGGAYLNPANLDGADLSGADLDGAYLSHASLIRADLSGADLRSSVLTSSDLSGADLSKANLRKASLDLSDLSGAYLSEVQGITNEKLERQAGSLQGATMPDGQKYEDWLKDKEGRGEDGENSGPSQRLSE